ncbi:unnamed protein product, partial [Heterotrigona itama]
ILALILNYEIIAGGMKHSILCKITDVTSVLCELASVMSEYSPENSKKLGSQVVQKVWSVMKICILYIACSVIYLTRSDIRNELVEPNVYDISVPFVSVTYACRGNEELKQPVKKPDKKNERE